MESTKSIRLRGYKMITDYIVCQFSFYSEEQGEVCVRREFIDDIAHFNYIIGRMENYLHDKKDYENFNLMCDWFDKDLDNRDYCSKDFHQFIVNNSVTDERDSD